ncbi:MAG: hypothetical protein KKC75_02815 [Nanoarchaeota archaeon]|nr:hypothetical protein [Nanoarchaeota archaeon]MBU1005760.1 hypothetical protein [Nanoarchaeota archaeon]MBU1946631.1 hypothetical protein [Nanoarchaeota archaeon]
MKAAAYLIVLFFLSSFVYGAVIHGSIYDLSLDEAKDIKVEIDTEPNQQFISKNGEYSFEVSSGEYILTATHPVSGLIESKAVENIYIRGDGSFVLDLILFPVIDTGLAGEMDDINVDDDYFKENPRHPIVFFIALFMVIIMAVILAFYTFKKIKSPENKKLSEKERPDDYYSRILDMIKKEKRVTQKEIRKQFPLSEAKISLIITELESKGIAKKIKKGRGNIIILRKK